MPVDLTTLKKSGRFNDFVAIVQRFTPDGSPTAADIWGIAGSADHDQGRYHDWCTDHDEGL